MRLGLIIQIIILFHLPTSSNAHQDRITVINIRMMFSLEIMSDTKNGGYSSGFDRDSLGYPLANGFVINSILLLQKSSRTHISNRNQQYF